MRKKAIPDDVRQKVAKIVAQFNKNTFHKDDCYYYIKFQGKRLYLDRYNYGQKEPVCCLTYTGKINNWEFAIFKWSVEAYDPEEFMFPGSEYVDGTIEGAMMAGLKAYPV